MKAELKKSVKEIRKSIDLEISILKSRMDSLEEKKKGDNFDPDFSIVVMVQLYNDGEDLNEKISKLLETGLECDPEPEIIGVTRLRVSGRRRGVVKAVFGKVEDKVAVLRCKQKLKNND